MFYDSENYSITIHRDKRDSDFGAYIEEITEVSASGEISEEVVEELKTVSED